jgi:hypothetical protein
VGEARAVETVLKAGEVLYLPSYWIHYIVSLELNMQCNCRSGVSPTPQQDTEMISACLSPFLAGTSAPADANAAPTVLRKGTKPGEAAPASRLQELQPRPWYEAPSNWDADVEAAAAWEWRTWWQPAWRAMLAGDNSAPPRPPRVSTFTDPEAAVRAWRAAGGDAGD